MRKVARPENEGWLAIIPRTTRERDRLFMVTSMPPAPSKNRVWYMPSCRPIRGEAAYSVMQLLPARGDLRRMNTPLSPVRDRTRVGLF